MLAFFLSFFLLACMTDEERAQYVHDEYVAPLERQGLRDVVLMGYGDCGIRPAKSIGFTGTMNGVRVYGSWCCAPHFGPRCVVLWDVK